MFRLLHAIYSLNPAEGGPASFVHQCALLQDAYDLSLEVACSDSPEDPWLQAFPAKVYSFPGPLKRYGPRACKRYAYSPKFVPWLTQNADRYDAIVVNGLWQFSSLGTWLALRDTKLPYFVFPHGMLDPWDRTLHPIKRLKKQLYWLALEHRVLKDARAVLFTSEQERILAQDSFLPYSVRAVVVPYGTIAPPGDINSYKTRFFQQFPQLLDKCLLVFLGRIHPKKGCDLLIKAVSLLCQEFPRLHLVLAGPIDKSYESKVTNLLKGCQSVTRANLVTGDHKWELLSAADALILPSHQENFGMVVTEALSCDTPVLLSNKVNIWPDIVRDQAGFVAPDTLTGTEQLIRRFLSLLPTERHSMRKAAKMCFANRFNRSQTYGQYVQMLKSLSKSTN